MMGLLDIYEGVTDLNKSNRKVVSQILIYENIIELLLKTILLQIYDLIEGSSTDPKTINKLRKLLIISS